MTFLRWIGGKRDVVHQLKDYFPDINNCKGYIEPFIGGGSVFFYVMQNYDLCDKPIYLSDINRELIITYRVVRDKVDELIPLLEKHQKLNNKEYFDNMRKIFPPGEGMSDVEKAAAFIYLSMCVFGSKWVVNSQGKLTTTYRGNEGENLFRRKSKKCDFYDDYSLPLSSKLLQGTIIGNHSFEKILEFGKFEKLEKFKDLRDFFVYLDPPYYDVGVKDYVKDKFSRDTKEKIRSVFEELDKKGAKVMMSNSDGPTIYSYFKNYNISIIKTDRVLNTFYTSDKKKSASINEVIVTNYKHVKKQKDIDSAWL